MTLSSSYKFMAGNVNLSEKNISFIVWNRLQRAECKLTLALRIFNSCLLQYLDFHSFVTRIISVSKTATHEISKH
jgi:hypothetical protein